MMPDPKMKYSKKNNVAIIAFGSSHGATKEAIINLKKNGIGVNYCQIKAFPFQSSIKKFIDKHKRVYIVEQNRDAQMRSLIMLDLEVDADKLLSILHYNGNPIYANVISDELMKSEKKF